LPFEERVQEDDKVFAKEEEDQAAEQTTLQEQNVSIGVELQSSSSSHHNKETAKEPKTVPKRATKYTPANSKGSSKTSS